MSPGPSPPTAQTYTQPYSTYPQPYSQYSTQQYPPDSTSWIDVLSPQELSVVNPEVASKAMNRFISAELKLEGFDAAEPAALSRLEDEVVHFIQDLHRRIHDYANLANRTAPLASDMFDISHQCGLDTDDLRLTSELSKWRRRASTTINESMALLHAERKSPPPKLLSSDDEGSPPSIPNTLRTIPHFYPTLPPKHTYLRTPPSPPRKQALPSLEKKLKNASLVQESLQNLLLATEDVVGPDDGEILGAIVNWETTVHPRKRWKLGA
ncbi:hypothetical protein F5148DRAFT_1276087 [Russula earlei]|uniref:Uncharacterized protein n=1 Tax=Russula earlei TaxID=71964 RepID=A0ACC0U8D8_9AGAM|nr:hypothetical protein F5148DRAFT_1276087 [Russula earlei]